MNKLDFHVDTCGMVGHIKWDKYRTPYLEFGDSLQRTATIGLITQRYRLAHWPWGPMRTAADVPDFLNWPVDSQYIFHLVYKKGELRRHWDDREWSGELGTGSRDNCHPLVMWLGTQGYKKELRRILFNLLLRGGRFWNYKKLGGKRNPWYKVDFVGPLVLGSFLKGLLNNVWYLWPLYYLILTLIEFTVPVHAFVRVLSSVFTPRNTSDHLNFQNYLLEGECYGKGSTTIGFQIGRWLYRKFVQNAWLTDTTRLTGNGPDTQLESYYRERHDKDGNLKHVPPPIPEIITLARFGHVLPQLPEGFKVCDL